MDSSPVLIITHQDGEALFPFEETSVNDCESYEGTTNDENPDPRGQSASTIAVHQFDEKTGKDLVFLVDWDSPDDLENPKVCSSPM